MENPILGQSTLAILLPEEVAKEVDRFRTRFDPHQQSIPPHITVIYPPFVALAEWPQIRGAMAECIAATPASDITLRECRTFAGPPHVLWLHPEDGGNLTRLNAAICRQFPALVPPQPLGYVPHATIGFFDSEEALTQARREVTAALKPLRFMVQAVLYAVRGEDGVWQFHDRLPLGKAEG